MTQLAIMVKDNKNLFSNYYLDIPQISFTTPPTAALVEQAKALYSNDPAFKCADFVSAPGSDNLDRINRIDRINTSNPVNPVHPVLTATSLIAAPDSQKILEFVGGLAKNKKKLKEGYDPTRHEPKEKLQEEFNASVGKLAPLLKRIEATDKLIDQIVYKLYRLTQD